MENKQTWRIEPGWRRSPHQGTSAVEMVMAMFLLVVLGLLCTQIITSSVRLRLEQRKRLFALQEANNALEKAFQMPWEELAKARVETWPCSPGAAQVLPKASVQVEINALDEDARRLAVTVQWPAGPGQKMEHVSLVAFRHKPAGPPPATASGG